MAKATGISLGSVQRIWRAHKLQPHRLRTFKPSRDPSFAVKRVDIDADLLAKTFIEAQDRQIAEISGKPRAPIKSLTRVRRR